MIQKSEAEKLLIPHLSTINSLMHQAWEEWWNSPYRGQWSKRGRATFVWEQMTDRAVHEFSMGNEIKPIPFNNSYLFLLDSLALRFKKLNERGLTSNYPTQASLGFYEQDEALPGIPSVARLDIGYLLNKLETKIDDILISYRELDSVKWSIRLSDHINLENVVLLEPSTLQTNAASRDSKSGLVKVKAPANKTKSAGDEK